jgi:hypothetical protein
MELTVTQKLRLFLARSGQVVAPWSSVDEVMDHLYALLYERRAQDGLWQDLAALLDSLQSERHGALAAPDAEILSRARVDSLVTELRRAMWASQEAPAAGAMRRFSVGKSAGVAACIALLAATFSLGCGSSNSKEDTRPADTAAAAKQDTAVPADTAPATKQDTAVLDSNTSPTPDAAVPDSTPDQARVDTASADTLPPPQDAAPKDTGDASISPGDAADATGDGSTGDALMDLFRDGTPDQIAAQLDASADRKNDTPIMMPAYKGVTFPPEPAV